MSLLYIVFLFVCLPHKMVTSKSLIKWSSAASWSGANAFAPNFILGVNFFAVWRTTFLKGSLLISKFVFCIRWISIVAVVPGFFLTPLALFFPCWWILFYVVFFACGVSDTLVQASLRLPFPQEISGVSHFVLVNTIQGAQCSRASIELGGCSNDTKTDLAESMVLGFQNAIPERVVKWLISILRHVQLAPFKQFRVHEACIDRGNVFVDTVIIQGVVDSCLMVIDINTLCEASLPKTPAIFTLWAELVLGVLVSWTAPSPVENHA